MTPALRITLTAAALAALTAAGCGSKPEPARPKPPAPSAKSESPSPPISPKPTEVVWGEAVNGLQIGLQVVGGREEMRLRRIADLTRVLARLTGLEHGMPVVRALDEATRLPELSYMKTQLEPLHREVTGGHTLSEALQLQRNGLIADQALWDGVKAGEAADDLPAAFARMADALEKKARPRGLFGEHKQVCTIVRLRNVSEKEITLFDSWLPFSLSLQFARLDASGPAILCHPEDLKKREIRPLVLPARAEVAVEFSVEPRWIFADRGPADGGWTRLKGVPPGKYAVTVGYGHGEHPTCEPCPCWHGGITSGAVQVEIRPLAVSEARAREIALKELEAKYPHTKWRLDHLEVTDDRVWRGSAQDAEPKPAMNSAVIDVDTDTGQVTWLQFYPGR